MTSTVSTHADYTIEQIYTGCLAQGAYFITSAGESAVIDPLRETTPYTSRIESSKTKLVSIFETHFHADFVSGHVDLAKVTGAPIVFGPQAEPQFSATIAKDEQAFKIGKVTLTALHTPGHTMESTCYLLKDASGAPKALFSGDTLFIGDVGRPDLAQKGTGLTSEDLAGYLYNSLRTKVMPLPDEVVVYPAHGAGSACGKNMSSETFDTLGNQKKTNYALRADMTSAEFITELTANLPAPPQYFPIAVGKNKSVSSSSTASSYDELLKNGMKKLSPDDVEKILSSQSSVDAASRPMIIDTRWHDAFTAAHIPGAIYAGIEGPFGPFIASAIGNVDRPFVIVGADEKLTEVFTRLSRFGFDNPLGHLEGGMDAWKAAGKPIATMENISADQLMDDLEANQELQLVDCRKPGEHKVKNLPQAKSLPLDSSNISKVDVTKPIYVHCGSGYRSVMFLSLVNHFNLSSAVVAKNVEGGMMKMGQSEKVQKHLYLSPCQRK